MIEVFNLHDGIILICPDKSTADAVVCNVNANSSPVRSLRTWDSKGCSWAELSAATLSLQQPTIRSGSQTATIRAGSPRRHPTTKIRC